MRFSFFASTALLALLAGSAAAQDFCAGAGTGGQWIGGGEGSSDIATAGTYQEQMALVLGGNAHIALFSVSAPASVRIEAQGRGAGDPLIDIFDETGNILMSDDDSGGNGAARAELDLEPGTYCVSTRSYDSAPMTAFVRVGLTDFEPLTEGVETTSNDDRSGALDGASCAEGVQLGTLTGTLENTDTVDDVPFLTFTLDEAAAISITADNQDADPILTLYDGDENYINENDDFDGLNPRLDMIEPLAAGDYCIGLQALNDSSLPVEVEVSLYDPQAAMLALVNRGDAAPSMDGTFPITDLGGLDRRMRHDAQAGENATWFSVDMPEAGVLLIEAIAPGEGGDPWIVLYDDLGRQIGLNDDNGDTYDSLLAARVNRGTYLVGLKDVAGNTGLVRMLFERYVPAP